MVNYQFSGAKIMIELAVIGMAPSLLQFSVYSESLMHFLQGKNLLNCAWPYSPRGTALKKKT